MCTLQEVSVIYKVTGADQIRDWIDTELERLGAKPNSDSPFNNELLLSKAWRAQLLQVRDMFNKADPQRICTTCQIVCNRNNGNEGEIAVLKNVVNAYHHTVCLRNLYDALLDSDGVNQKVYDCLKQYAEISTNVSLKNRIDVVHATEERNGKVSYSYYPF